MVVTALLKGLLKMNNSSLTFVLGGAKSGKSEFAEHLYSRKERICYIATGVVKIPMAKCNFEFSVTKLDVQING